VNLFQFNLSSVDNRSRSFLFGDRIWVEVGRFGYSFNRFGKSMGGWIPKPKSDAEWQEWMEKLKPRP
jgi:hypothetical protein